MIQRHAPLAAFCAHLSIDLASVDIGNLLSRIPAQSFSMPLDLHMSILAAACAQRDQQSAPQSSELSEYLIDHERRTWGLQPDPALETSVLLATLVGPVEGAANGRKILRAAALANEDAELDQLLIAHQKYYPQLSTESDGWAPLQPLRPDRLGEDFVGLSVSEPRLRDVVYGVLSEMTTGDTGGLLRRGLTVLGAAAERHVGAWTTLERLLLSDPDRIKDAPAAVIRLVAERAPSQTARDLLAKLPLYIDERCEAAARLAARVANDASTDSTLLERFKALTDASQRFDIAGLLNETLSFQRQAVSVARALANSTERIGEFLLFAESASHLATKLWNRGDGLEAIEWAAQAVTLFRKAASSFDDDHGPLPLVHATALWTLGIILAEALHDCDRGLALTKEAVDVIRDIPGEGLEKIDALAIALHNLGVRHMDANEHIEAVIADAESVELTRQLVEVNTEQYTSRLAGALINLAIGSLATGDIDAAIESAEEGLAIRRIQAGQINSEERQRDLARAFQVSGRAYWADAKFEHALHLMDEAGTILDLLSGFNIVYAEERARLAIERGLVAEGDKFSFPLSSRSVDVSLVLWGAEMAKCPDDLQAVLAKIEATQAALTEDPETALNSLREAEDVLQQYGETSNLEIDLARIIAWRGIGLANSNENIGASIEALQNTISLCRKHIGWDGAQIAFCDAGFHLASLLAREDQQAAALSLMAEVVETYRPLVLARQSHHRSRLPLLVQYLMYQSELLLVSKEVGAAVNVLIETCEFSRELMQRNRNLEDGVHYLAMHLRAELALARAFARSGQLWRSVSVSYEGVKCGWEILGLTDFGRRYEAAQALAAHARYVLAVGRTSEALKVAEEAVTHVLHEPDEADRVLHYSIRSDVYAALARCLDAAGRHKPAESTYDRADDSLRKVIEQNPQGSYIRSRLALLIEIGASAQRNSQSGKRAQAIRDRILSLLDAHASVLKDNPPAALISYLTDRLDTANSTAKSRIKQQLDRLGGTETNNGNEQEV